MNFEKIGQDKKNEAKNFSKGFLRRFKDKITLLVAGASIFAGSADLHAQGTVTALPPINKDAVVEKAAPKDPKKIFTEAHAEMLKNIDESKITENGRYFSNLLSKVKEQESSIKDKIEAMDFIRSVFGVFGKNFQEFVKSKEGDSREDYLVVANTGQELMDIFVKVAKLHNIHEVNIGNEKEYLTSAIQRCLHTFDVMTKENTPKKFNF